MASLVNASLPLLMGLSNLLMVYLMTGFIVVIRMQSRGHHVIHFAAIVLICLGLTYGIHGKIWTRLPNLVESPYLKDQSFLVCTGEKYLSFKVELFPKRISCGESIASQITLTPRTDILYLECQTFLKWNGIVLYTKVHPGLCSEYYLNCPVLKGKKYTLHPNSNMSPTCFLAKGHYNVTVSCTDQNDEEIACAMWTFTWVQ